MVTPALWSVSSDGLPFRAGICAIRISGRNLTERIGAVAVLIVARARRCDNPLVLPVFKTQMVPDQPWASRRYLSAASQG